MSETLYKVLGVGGVPCHGGNGLWHRNGKWMPWIEKIKPCERGYHLCREQDLLQWLGPEIWLAQWRGDRIDEDNKVVVSQARIVKRLKSWNEKTARLFASDCAEHVLHFFEKKYPNNNRPRDAIAAARDFANGKISMEQLAAASDAAWDASWAAARAAARAASRAAASDAAWDAAWAASRDASRAAALDDEQEWQTKKLMEYLWRCDD